MANFYIDETIQKKGKFIIASVVYSKCDLTPHVSDALIKVGLQPGVDEFKSSIKMASHPEQCELRDLLKDILHRQTKIGMIVTPMHSRQNLGDEVLTGISKIIQANALQEGGDIYFDSEIYFKKDSENLFIEKVGASFNLHVGQDSKIIGGIQVADLTAHSLGTMLLDQMGLIKKKVRAGENSGYDPDSMIELGFELWATLRYSFFKSPNGMVPLPITEHFSHADYVKARTHDVADFGLYISPECDDLLRHAASERFGDCYLGCIH